MYPKQRWFLLQVAVRSEEPYRLQCYSFLSSLSNTQRASEPDTHGIEPLWLGILSLGLSINFTSCSVVILYKIMWHQCVYANSCEHAQSGMAQSFYLNQLQLCKHRLRVVFQSHHPKYLRDHLSGVQFNIAAFKGKSNRERNKVACLYPWIQ